MKMINKKSGEAVYFNPIRKNGKDQWLIQGIGSTVVLGRDRHAPLRWPGLLFHGAPVV